MIGVCHCAQKFLPRLALNYDPPDFYLPSAEDYRLVSLCLNKPYYFFSWVFVGIWFNVESPF
jgi:hypothetical protein